MKHNKVFFNTNRYQQELLNKINQLNFKNLDRLKTIGPEKCIVTLKVSFINKSSEIKEKKIRYLKRNTFYAANPRIIFTTKPLLIPCFKVSVSNFNISMVVFQYSCCCTASYNELLTRQLR